MDTEKNISSSPQVLQPGSGYNAILEVGKKMYGEKFNLDDPLTREKYRQIFTYFSSAGECDLDRKRGLMIVGSLGVGKTSCMRIMNALWHRYKRCHAKWDIEQMVKNKEVGEIGVMSAYGRDFKKELYIDDIGTEEVINNYGNRVPIIEQLLMSRYDLWQQEGIRTHFSTNLLTNELIKRYGERNFDRFTEFFNVIAWKGVSFRSGL